MASVASKYLKVCLYGENGRGKSSLLAEFPKPLILFSFEPTRSGGPGSLRNVPGVKVLRWGSPDEVKRGDAEFSSLLEAVRAAEDLRDNGARGYRTVGVDGATGIQRLVTATMLSEAGRDVPESVGYGVLTDDQNKARPERVKQCLIPFLDIPAHVVVTAKEKDFSPPKEYNDKGRLQVDLRPRIVRSMGPKSFIGPEVSASTMSWLVDACGYTFRLYTCLETTTSAPSEINGVKVPGIETETGRYQIRMWLKQHDNYAGRGCFPNPENVPESIGGTPRELYQQLVRLIEGK